MKSRPTARLRLMRTCSARRASLLLRETLQEEKDTDEKLTELASEINASTEEGEGEEIETKNSTLRPAHNATAKNQAWQGRLTYP